MAQIHPPPPVGDSPLENPQREAFAQAVARGETAVEAYRISYGGEDRGRPARASRVAKLPEVRARVRHLRQGASGQTEGVGSLREPVAPDSDEGDGSEQPYAFSARIARRFCARLVETRRSLKAICHEKGMPDLKTLLRWLDTEPKFRTQYARARALQAELIADEILEIADDASEDFKEDANGKPRVDAEAIQRSKLRIDTRKWLVAKLLPKKYGDKTEDASTAAASGSGQDEVSKYRLTEERRAALIERRRQAILACKKRHSSP